MVALFVIVHMFHVACYLFVGTDALMAIEFNYLKSEYQTARVNRVIYGSIDIAL